MKTDFLIRPLEPLYFGPPRSAAAGEAHRGRSVFPPGPRTFQGLVRTRLLRAALPPIDLDGPGTRSKCRKLIGPPDRLLEEWQLTGPIPVGRAGDGKAVMRGHRIVEERSSALPVRTELEEGELQPWFATPRFLLANGTDGAPVRAQRIRGRSGDRPEGAIQAQTDLGPVDEDRPLLGEPRHRPLGGWVSARNLQFALKGKGAWRTEEHTPGWPRFVRLEVRPGVAIESDGTAQDHMLYFLEMLRFDELCGFAGSLSAPAFSEGIPDDALHRGLAFTGRKGRLACFERLPETVAESLRGLASADHIPSEVAPGFTFWLVLASPVCLKEPRDPFAGVSPQDGVHFRTLGALVGEAEIHGGFDLVSHSARPNRRFLPAGSTWCVAVEDGDSRSRAAALSRLHDAHVLGDPGEASLGFGHTFVSLFDPSTGRSDA
jgi:CRISPR type III-B/RAMP module-associated protein Cmr3